MNKKTGNMLFLLIIIILAFGIKMIMDSFEKREGFVPGINAFYRPYARKIENYTSEKFQNISHNFKRLFKKYKLM